MGLLEEVWEQDTTLINVLDETGVAELPAFKKRINDIEQEQIYQKSQLDSLGNTLNHYQQSTEAELALINTRINNSDQLLAALNTKCDKLRHDIDEISFQINLLNNKVVKAETDVNQIKDDLNSIGNQLKTFDRQIESLERRVDSTVSRINYVEPVVKYNSEFLVDSTAIFEGSQVIIVDVGGKTVEWAYSTIGSRIGRQITAPCRYVTRYVLDPKVMMNGYTYSSLVFIGIGRTESQPVASQDTLVSWGYQLIRMITDKGGFSNFSVFMLKPKYEKLTVKKKY